MRKDPKFWISVLRGWFERRQKDRCAICGVHFLLTKPHLDHCHDTGKTRGALCRLCNHGLGCFRDNIQFLENAISYLQADHSGNPPHPEDIGQAAPGRLTPRKFDYESWWRGKS